MSRWHRTEFDLLPERAFRPRPGGGMTLEGGGGGGNSNYDQIQAYTAMMQGALSQQQLDWAQRIYAEQAPARDAATSQAQQISQAQLDQMRQQTQIAAQAQEDYQQTFRPVEQQLAAEAMSYDTPERRAAAAAEATASVEQQLAAQRGATMREMERSGVDPSSGKTAALAASMDLNAAKLKAGAGTAASRNVETVGRAMRADVANLGRGIASSQATNAALASTLGGQAIGATGAGLAAQQQGANFLQGAYGQAVSGLGSAGSAFGNLSNRAATASQQSANDTAAGVGAFTTLAAAFI